MKTNLIDLLTGTGFTEKPVENEILQDCNGLILQREWSKETEVVWYGKRTTTFSVQVFINRKSSICHAAFSKDGREIKSRWYDTIGKRTYNAIAETVKNSGFGM